MDDFAPAPGEGPSSSPLPDPWLVSLAPAFRSGVPGPVLDLACGPGQNALWVASLGAEVLGVDRGEEGLARARAEALRRGLAASFRCLDVEAGPLPGGVAAWGAVLVFHFLHRPLFPRLSAALAPGGLLAYKTHLGHPLRGTNLRPRRAAFLLQPGELLAAFPDLTPLDYREWAWRGAAHAALLARRPAHSW